MANIALLAPFNNADLVFAPHHFARLAALGTLTDARFAESAAEVLERLAEVEYIVSTWGMPAADEPFLARVPRLRGIFYAAGSVKGIVTPAMYARGIVISSAAPMNAIPVAEYTVAMIVLSNKRCWQHLRKNGYARRDARVVGNYQRTVGIISASMVGREVLRLLRGYDLRVLLYDPYVSAEEAERLGATKSELPELMATADVVSLHAPNLPALRHLINAELLARMPDGATFINTARGALVDESALLAEVTSGRLWAVLDVTDPEPPVAGSPFYTCPHVILTPHIAGAMTEECRRMADFALDELASHLAGKPLRNAVSAEKLAILA